MQNDIVAPVHPDGASLLRHVMRYRRRLQWVRFVRHLSVACAIAMTAAAIALVLRLGPATAWMWLAAATAVALTSATIFGLARRQSVRATGAAIDLRLRLQDRVAAGLQLLESPEPIAALIVRDATSRLDRARPAHVFPLDVRNRALVAGAAVGAALLIATADLSRPPRGTPSGRPGPSSGGVSRLAEPGSMPSGRDKADEPTMQPPSIATVNEVTKRPGESPLTPRLDSTDAAAIQTEASRTGLDGRPEPGGRRTVNDAGSVLPSRTTSEHLQRPGRDDRQSTSGGPPTGTTAQSRASGAAPETQSARGPGAMGEGAPKNTFGAGGVSGGSLGPDQVTHLPEPTVAGLTSAARSRFVRAQAEAALSRDDIPPALRKFVRDYFLALQSAGPK